MRAALFDADSRTFSIAERPRPELPGDMVLVRIETVGICGSDLHLVRSGLYGGEEVPEPVVLGHEFSGVIEAIGSRVQDKRLAVGARVAVEPTISCGTCEFCLAGRDNICPKQRFCGMPPHPGGFQEYMLMPARNLYPVPDHLGPDAAMLAEPLAIAVHARRIAGIAGGETVAVVGCGSLGLLITKVFDLAGARVLLAVEPLDVRRNLATRLGAAHAVHPDREPVKVLSDFTSGRLADVVVEAAGPPEALRLALRLVRPGGTLVYVGIHPGPMEIDFTPARRREMVWKWVRRTTHAYPEAINLLASGRVDAGMFVTHHWPLEKITEAFRFATGYLDGIVKGAVQMSPAP